MSNGHFDIGVTEEDDFTQPGNRVGLLSTGPFPTLASGESIRVVFAMTLGTNENLLRYNSRLAKQLFDSGYNTPISAVAEIPASRGHLDLPFPNPFNPSTTLGFNLSAAGPMVLSIHDLKGHLIRTLAEGYRKQATTRPTGTGAMIPGGLLLRESISSGFLQTENSRRPKSSLANELLTFTVDFPRFCRHQKTGILC